MAGVDFNFKTLHIQEKQFVNSTCLKICTIPLFSGKENPMRNFCYQQILSSHCMQSLSLNLGLNCSKYFF